MKILIEGWRGINHSYAIVNQFQLLELLNYENIKLFHRDVPFYNSQWISGKDNCGLSESDFHRVFSIKDYVNNEKTLDIIYRISFPYNLSKVNSKKLFVFGTSEFQDLPRNFFSFKTNKSDFKNENLKIITPSNWSKVGFLKAGFRGENVLVIPHGINTEIFFKAETERRDSFRTALGISKNDFLIGSIGSMTWNKGIDILIKSFYYILKKYPNAKLLLKDQSLLYGITAKSIVLNILNEISNNDKDKSLALNNIICLSSNITFKQLNGIYSACDCYVSSYRAEGFNIPPLEAAACGVPIIITSGGSTDDYFDPSFALKIQSKLVSSNNNNYLEPCLDNLTFLIEQVIDGKFNFDYLKAKKIITDKFGWHSIVQNLITNF